MWLFGLVAKKQKKKWYDGYWTVAPIIFSNPKRMTLYGPPKKWSNPNDVIRGHEARHFHNTDGLWYLLWPWYRLSEELNAYEVNMGAQVLRHGRVPSEYFDHLVDELYWMYFLFPVMTKGHIREKVIQTVLKVEARAGSRG